MSSCAKSDVTYHTLPYSMEGREGSSGLLDLDLSATSLSGKSLPITLAASGYFLFW